MTLDLMDLVIARVEIEEGRSPSQVALQGGVHLNCITAVQLGSRQYSDWQPWEDQYLSEHLGYQTEEEIAKYLGRTVTGIHLRWKRVLRLPAPSKHPDFLTGRQAAALLGIYSHKIMHWCDIGLIPARRMRGQSEGRERVIRLIDRDLFNKWVVNPENWIYFDWKKIPDEHLRKLCEQEAK